jgi:hypothetical protein
LQDLSFDAIDLIGMGLGYGFFFFWVIIFFKNKINTKKTLDG